jgi:hypothetical protein
LRKHPAEVLAVPEESQDLVFGNRVGVDGAMHILNERARLRSERPSVKDKLLDFLIEEASCGRITVIAERGSSPDRLAIPKDIWSTHAIYISGPFDELEPGANHLEYAEYSACPREVQRYVRTSSMYYWNRLRFITSEIEDAAERIELWLSHKFGDSWRVHQTSEPDVTLSDQTWNSKQETGLKAWLVARITVNKQPIPKRKLMEEARRHFRIMPDRAFNRAWSAVAPESWKKPGRRSSKKSMH